MNTRIGGFGIVGVGDAGDPDPFPHRKRPDLCASCGHPGATFNPWLNKTWCLCGEVVRAGDQATHDDCCCGGRLIECLHDLDEVAA